MKKYLLTYPAILLCLFVFLAAMPIAGEEAIYTDVIRLHVIAASDGDADQAAKLSVRDAILREYGAAFAAYATREEAEAAARTVLPDIERTAEETLRGLSIDDTVAVTLTVEEYGRRDYTSFSLPSGSYLSLRVMIGEASGQNWWCVLYPPLCTETAYGYKETVTGDGSIPVGLTPEEYEMITGESDGYVVKFKVLELLSDLIG